MKQYIKFLLARFLGTKHSRELPVKDGVVVTLTGYLWRGTFFATDMKHAIVNPAAHRNAMRQVLGHNKPADDEKRIFVPGGRR